MEKLYFRVGGRLFYGYFSQNFGVAHSNGHGRYWINDINDIKTVLTQETIDIIDTHVTAEVLVIQTITVEQFKICCQDDYEARIHEWFDFVTK